jgi:hypothetical protein
MKRMKGFRHDFYRTQNLPLDLLFDSGLVKVTALSHKLSIAGDTKRIKGNVYLFIFIRDIKLLL